MFQFSLTDKLVVASSALGAVSTGLIAHQAAGANALQAALIGIVVFLAAGQIHNWSIRRRERLALDGEFTTLKVENARLAEEVELTHRRMTELVDIVESRSAERAQKIVSEVRVLETLIRQFGEQMAGRVRALETRGSTSAATPHTATLRAPVTPPPLPAGALDDPQLLELIQRALLENRVDLHVQPVVTLPQRKLRFYEGLTRLRTEDGKIIMPTQYLRVAEPAGLMSTIDNLLLFRCVQIVRRLAQRNREAGIFCNISGDTLRDRTFFPQFLDFMQHHRDLGPQIIFEFGQETIAKADAEDEDALRRLSSLGFAFSLDKVTTIDGDWRRLATLGFGYVKVPARVLLSVDARRNGDIDRADLKGLLGRYGLTLIAEKVETEREAVDLLDLGVELGQGFLFGAPRPVREGDAPAEQKQQSPTAAPPRLPLRIAG